MFKLYRFQKNKNHFEFHGRSASQGKKKKAGEVSVSKKKELEVNWEQASKMIGYKKIILERRSLSGVKMGWEQCGRM